MSILIRNVLLDGKRRNVLIEGNRFANLDAADDAAGKGAAAHQHHGVGAISHDGTQGEIDVGLPAPLFANTGGDNDAPPGHLRQDPKGLEGAVGILVQGIVNHGQVTGYQLHPVLNG
jgi:hypothetical protein